MINLYDLSLDELTEWVVGLGQKAFRARQIWGWMYDRRAASFAEMVNLPRGLVAKLDEEAALGRLRIAAEQHSADGTEKRLYRLIDGQLIETVLMAYESARRTVCLSTQAGCALGCVFCATGQMGFGRHLGAGEIFEQAMIFARELAARDERLSNVVLMGMGEPFHNYEACLEAVRRMINRLGIGARHITISTVGLAPQIRRFADEGLQVSLAVSLHRADDAERSALMPVNRRWPLAELLAACRYYTAKTGRRITFEWAAMAGENDSRDEAHRLGRLLAGMLCHVNIIPLNPTGGYGGRPADAVKIDKFRSILKHYAVGSSVRVRRGLDIEAGCGQLKTALVDKGQMDVSRQGKT